MKYPTTKETHAYMKMRQDQNLRESRDNPNELWMAAKLKATGIKWTRQAQWGYRLFDFWNYTLGIAIEVDGATHNAAYAAYDAVRDEHNYRRSGILVIRVRNRNECDAQKALDVVCQAIETYQSWNARRASLGLKPIKGADLEHSE